MALVVQWKSKSRIDRVHKTVTCHRRSNDFFPNFYMEIDFSCDEINSCRVSVLDSGDLSQVEWENVSCYHDPRFSTFCSSLAGSCETEGVWVRYTKIAKKRGREARVLQVGTEIESGSGEQIARKVFFFSSRGYLVFQFYSANRIFSFS